MADVTFIIGNGLDISLGLKTSYGDFYNHIRKSKPNSRNRIYKTISNDPKTWAEFEFTLGVYTQFIEDIPENDRKKISLDFHNELEEITNDLGDYLEAQEKNLDIGEGFKFGLQDFFTELPEGQRVRILPHVPIGKTRFNFVTLNYTNVLEKMFPNTGVFSIPSRVMISTIHHIHGDLSDNMTLGVNDESQLSSALTGDELDDLIKPKIISSMNDGRIEQFKQLIDQSSTVVLFGTSIGDTDKYIWAYLIDWLSLNPSNHIVIHKYDSSYTDSVRRLQRRKKLFASEVQNKLLGNADLSDTLKTDYRNRIFVVHNTNKLFAIKSNLNNK